MTTAIALTDRTDFLKEIEDGLTAYQQEATGMTRAAVNFILTENDACRGGIKAHCAGGHFFVSWLFVDKALRGHGWGTRLMQAAENEARKRDCTAILVDTLSFQAPAFYEKLGYATCARISDFYPGYDRIFYRKAIP